MEKNFKILVHDGKFVDVNNTMNMREITYSEVPMIFHKDFTIEKFIEHTDKGLTKGGLNKTICQVIIDLLASCKFIDVTLAITKPKNK